MCAVARTAHAFLLPPRRLLIAEAFCQATQSRCGGECVCTVRATAHTVRYQTDGPACFALLRLEHCRAAAQVNSIQMLNFTSLAHRRLFQDLSLADSSNPAGDMGMANTTTVALADSTAAASVGKLQTEIVADPVFQESLAQLQLTAPVIYSALISPSVNITAPGPPPSPPPPSPPPPPPLPTWSDVVQAAMSAISATLPVGHTRYVIIRSAARAATTTCNHTYTHVVHRACMPPLFQTTVLGCD